MARKRRSRVDLGTYVPSPAIPPASLEDIVDEGLMIAESAVRLAAKNRLIVRAAGERLDFDEQAMGDAVRAELEHLAAQNEQDGRRISQARQDALHAAGKATHQHDYRISDAAQLERRGEVYQALADGLRAAGDDAGFVTRVVAQAREDAWHELGESIQSRLTEVVVDPRADRNYAKLRAERLKVLIDFDLAALAGSGVPTDAVDPAPDAADAARTDATAIPSPAPRRRGLFRRR